MHEHPTAPIQYDGPPIQPHHVQSYPVVPPLPEYVYAFHEQVFPDHCESLPNGPIYREQPGFPPSGVPYEPVNIGNEEIYQNHNYNPFPCHASSEAHPSYPVQYHNAHYAKLGNIAQNSRELWFAFAPFKAIPGSIRIFMVIHHVYTRFRARFSEGPSLSMFMDGLSNNKDMRPIRNINGLQCKACCLRLGSTSNADADKESYSLPQLVRHFHQRHVEQPFSIAAPVLNWHTDMIYLPWDSLSRVGSLMNLDDKELGPVLSALPEIAWSSSQSHPSPGPVETIPPNYRTPSPGHHLSISKPSKKQPPVQQRLTRSEWKRRIIDLQNNSMHSVAGSPSKDTRSKPHTVRNKNKSSQPEAIVRGPIAAADAMPQNHESPKGAEEDEDEDDNFDLMAGLELQLDQQALSTCPNNPVG